MATIQPIQIPQNYNAVKIDINNPQVKVPQQPQIQQNECQNCTAPIYEYPKAPIYEMPKLEPKPPVPQAPPIIEQKPVEVKITEPKQVEMPKAVETKTIEPKQVEAPKAESQSVEIKTTEPESIIDAKKAEEPQK